MTYAQAIALQAIDPITILEIDTTQNQTLFVYEEPGIAKITLSTDDFPDFTFWSASDTYSTTDVNVSSLQVYDGTDWLSYSKTTSLANCKTQNKSFYFDYSTQTVYIHFDSYEPWYTFETVTLGLSDGYADRAYHDGNVYYEPRLLTNGLNISRNKNADFYGVTRYDPMTFTLINDGALDDVVTSDIYGRSGRIKITLSEDSDTTTTLFTGRVENVPRISQTEVDITLADLRKFLSKNIPSKYFEQTTYTNLNENDVGKVIPFAFGNIRGAELVCINQEETSPTNYTFMLADTTTWNLKSGQTVVTYVDGETTANLNFSNTAGTIQIAATNVDPENQTVTADFTGFVDDSNDEIINGLDVIKNLITEYAGIEYTSDNYDTTEWASSTTDAYDISLFINDRTPIIDVINEISASLLGLFYITDDGKYSFKYSDYDTDSVKTISKEELLDFVEATYDSEEFLTSVIVKYSPHQESGKYRRVVDESLEETIYETYKVYRSKEFETIIDNATDAADYADRRYTFSKQIRPEFEVELGFHHSDLELLDNITIEMDRVYTDWYGLIKCHIIGIDKDLSNYSVKLRLKYIEDVTECLTSLDGGYSDAVSEMIIDGGSSATTTAHCTFDGGTSA